MIIKEFVKYNEALELKKIGFNEPCFCWFDERFKDDLLQDKICKNDALFMTELDCSAPIHQQVFRWFREKHQLEGDITHLNDGRLKWGYMIKNIVDSGYESKILACESKFDTFEEAEVACIKKLIEVVK